MTADEGREGDLTDGDDGNEFVFGEDRSAAGRSEPDRSLERRLAPVVAFLLIASLVVAGGYLLVGPLSGSGEDVLGSTAGPEADGASADDPTSTSGEDATTLATTAAAGTTVTGSSTAPATTGESSDSTDNPTADAGSPTSDSATTDPATGGTTTPAATAEGATTVGTPRSTGTSETPEATESTETASRNRLTAVRRTIAEPTATGPATETSKTTERTTTSTSVATDGSNADTEATATPESRSPSIDDIAVTSETDDESVTVVWDASDPDGDLETVLIRVVVDPGDSAQVAASRTVEVDGSEASGDTTLDLGGVTAGEAYEIRLQVEDETGNVALAVRRETTDE